MSGSRSDLENLGIGMFCAPIFTVTLQPTIYLKHAKMQGLPLSMNPKMLWRGTTASMCNETGQAGLQFLTTGFIKRWAGVHRGRALTPLEDAAGSAAGGAVSALWVSPVELVMIQQQRFGGSVAHTLCRIQRNFGWYGFSRGYLATGLRDSVYVIGMLSATPFMEKEMKRLGFGAATGSVVASLAAGVAAGVLSCPFDCIKTCMKGDLERENFKALPTPAGTCTGMGASAASFTAWSGVARASSAASSWSALARPSWTSIAPLAATSTYSAGSPTALLERGLSGGCAVPCGRTAAPVGHTSQAAVKAMRVAAFGPPLCGAEWCLTGMAGVVLKGAPPRPSAANTLYMAAGRIR
eukprot:CAMPEP_0176093076 /NCGR_PEP_ID=MMETSP0120_2-20121206/46635_1 /TAXON_ID=160619 /ORGANISM="Kryptoperidinium foliaceum, Strain CCMP 1326" /LENGTH=352 /DNA_ID=CAMNT_0017427003 /DNA_START=63 /DNA_END=1120 /DNA_ORIENTATION=-